MATEKQSEIINIPYYKSYATDLITYQLRLTAEQMIKTQTAIAEICLYGETNYIPESNIEKLYFNKLHDDLKISIKQYKANVENGKKGGRPKREKKPMGSKWVNPNDNPNDNHNITITKTITKDINKKEIYKEKYYNFNDDVLNTLKLTHTDLNKLYEKYENKDVDIYLKKLALYIGSNGKRYKSHYLTILNWMNRDNINTRDQISKMGRSLI